MNTPRAALALLLCTMSNCGVVVAPNTDASTSDATADSFMDAASPPDSSAAASCQPLRSCDDQNPCGDGPCSTCVLVSAFRPEPEPEGTVRPLGAACLQDQYPGNPLRFPTSNGRIACNEPEFATLILDGPQGGVGICVRREQCLALYDAYVGLARPDEVTHRCRFSDFTFVTREPVTSTGLCNRELGLCEPSGCACPAGQVCAFASQAVPLGACVPPTSFEPTVSKPCRAMPDRASCPAGESCLLPLRRDNNIPDRERWGVCMATSRCRGIVDHLGAQGVGGFYFRCDTTLTVTDAGVADAR